MLPEHDDALTRDPDELVREIDARILLGERREWQRIRQELAFHWLEFLLLAGLFAFSIGLVVTLIYGLPAENEPLYFFMVLWSVGWVIVALVAFEFLIRRYRALRRSVELIDRRFERIERILLAQRESTKEGKH